MATFTVLHDNDVQALAGRFALGEVVSWNPIAAGTINSNFAVTTSQGKYFLRINEGKSKDDVAYEAALIGALSARGISTPQPCACGDAYYTNYQGHWVSAFPWVPGRHLGRDEVTEEYVAILGQELAKLHDIGLTLLDDFARESIYTFEAIERRFARFAGSQDPALSCAIPAIAEEFAWLKTQATIRDAVPLTVIHGDLFRDNVLFNDRNLPVFIDFEQASTGSPAYDLAVCINAWCFTDMFLPQLVRALVTGYGSIRPLSASERAALYPESRAAAVRFAVTRITDIYLPGNQQTGKDFRRYVRRGIALKEIGNSGFSSWLSV